MMALDPINVNVKEKTSQELKKIVLSGRALNVFVIVIVFVFVFVVVFFRSCFLITLIKCLKGHKSLGSLFEGVLLMSLYFQKLS